MRQTSANKQIKKHAGRAHLNYRAPLSKTAPIWTTRPLARFVEVRMSRGRPRRALHSGTLLTFARMLAQNKKNGGDDGKDGDDGDHGSNDCTHSKDKAEKEEREEDEEPRQRARETTRGRGGEAEKDAEHNETETKMKDK